MQNPALVETVAAIAAQLVATPSSELDHTISTVLCTIGTARKIDRIRLCLLSGDKTRFLSAHKWCAPDIESRQNVGDDRLLTDCSWWMATMVADGAVVINHVDDLPAEATTEKARLNEAGVQSVFETPLVDEGKIIGYIGLEMARHPANWSSEDRRLLAMVADLLTGALRRREIDEQVRANQERYQHLVVRVDSLIGVFDVNGHLLYANESLVRAFGGSKESLLGRHISTLSSYEFPRLEADIRSVITMNKARFSERCSVYPAPNCWYRVNIQPVRDGNGVVEAAVVNAQEITEEKLRLQDETQAQLELEHLVSVISSRFIDLQFNEVDAAIQQTLAEIGAYTDAECVHLFSTNGDVSAVRAVHEWCMAGADERPHLSLAAAFADLTWSIEMLKRDGSLNIAHVAALPAEAHSDKSMYTDLNIRSLLAVALSFEEDERAILCISAVAREHIWRRLDQELLDLVGRTLTKTFARWREEARRREANRLPELRFAERTLDALRLARAIEGANDGMAIVKNKRFIYVNPALAKLYGYTVDELIGQPWNALNSVVDNETLIESIVVELRTQGVWTGITPARTKQGDALEVETNVTVVGDELFLYVRDVTERTGTERALRQAERRYRLLFEDAPIMYATLGEDSLGVPVITDCNRMLLTSLGYAREELVGRPLGTLHTPESRESLCERFMNGEARLLMAEECELLTRNGDRLHALLQTRHETDANGQFTQILAMYVDVSALKAAEEKLLNLGNLYRSLAQRLVTVREDERSQIALTIHDDLGQMLTALKLQADWLAKNLPSEKIPGLTKRVESMREVIVTTIKSVQRLSTELRPSILDTLGLVPAIAWQLQQVEEHTGLAIHFSTTVPQTLELPPALATALFRILQEALTNVARHAQARCVDVSLDLLDDRLRLIVRDDGRGFDPAILNAPRSLGVIGMRERLAPWQGTLELSTAPECGTEVRAEVEISSFSENER